MKCSHLRVGMGVLILAVSACRESVAPTLATMPLRCQLTEFTLDDRVTFPGAEIHLGPEMRGRVIVQRTDISASGALGSWRMDSDSGMVAYWRYREPGVDVVDWAVVIGSGIYTGTWKLVGGRIWWSFDTGQSLPRQMAWLTWRDRDYGGWRWEPPKLTARWGDYEVLGWQLRSEFSC